MDTDRLAPLVRAMLQQGTLAERLYRYRTIDRAKEALSSGTMWFSAPARFNDPFDCNIKLDTDNTLDELVSYVKGMRDEFAPAITDQEVELRAKEMHADPKALNAMMNQSAQEELSKWGICCFSKEWNILLQWSHYAASHSGLVMGFEVQQDPAFFVAPVNVEYSPAYPKYNHMREPEQLVQKLIRTKALEWAHEQEVRILKNKSGSYTFKKSALVELTFGVKCLPDDVQTIRQEAHRHGYSHLRFYQAKLLDRNFGLERISL